MKTIIEARTYAKTQTHDCFIIKTVKDGFQVKAAYLFKTAPANLVEVVRYSPDKSVLRNSKQRRPISTKLKK